MMLIINLYTCWKSKSVHRHRRTPLIDVLINIHERKLDQRNPSILTYILPNPLICNGPPPPPVLHPCLEFVHVLRVIHIWLRLGEIRDSHDRHPCNQHLLRQHPSCLLNSGYSDPGHNTTTRLICNTRVDILFSSMHQTPPRARFGYIHNMEWVITCLAHAWPI
jgi:hypothetical protein